MPDLSSRKNLTDLTAGKIKPKADRFEVPDNGCPGLRLVVQPSGAKSWAVRTRLGGKPVKITLGALSDDLGIVEARKAARSKLEALAAEPAPEHLAPPAAELLLPPPVAGPDGLTVGFAWAAYIAQHDGKASTLAKWKSFFTKHCLPVWSDHAVASINQDDLRPVINAAYARGVNAGDFAITVLSAFFTWCTKARQGYIAVNPVAAFGKVVPASRDRILSNAEMKVFWKGCDKLGPIFGPMFQFMLLSGARRSEVAGMRYDELDLKKRLWVVPGERTKNGLPLAVHLTDAMIAAFNATPRLQVTNAAGELELSPFVFSRYGHSAASGFSKAKDDLDKLAKIANRWTLHDLRRTFVSGLAALKVPATVIEKTVNHSSGTLAGVAGVYNVYAYIEEKTAAWKLWSDHITTITKGK
jgi:integrase